MKRTQFKTKKNDTSDYLIIYLLIILNDQWYTWDFFWTVIGVCNSSQSDQNRISGLKIISNLEKRWAEKYFCSPLWRNGRGSKRCDLFAQFPTVVRTQQSLRLDHSRTTRSLSQPANHKFGSSWMVGPHQLLLGSRLPSVPRKQRNKWLDYNLTIRFTVIQRMFKERSKNEFESKPFRITYLSYWYWLVSASGLD